MQDIVCQIITRQVCFLWNHHLALGGCPAGALMTSVSDLPKGNGRSSLKLHDCSPLSEHFTRTISSPVVTVFKHYTGSTSYNCGSLFSYGACAWYTLKNVRYIFFKTSMQVPFWPTLCSKSILLGKTLMNILHLCESRLFFVVHWTCRG